MSQFGVIFARGAKIFFCFVVVLTPHTHCNFNDIYVNQLIKLVIYKQMPKDTLGTIHGKLPERLM